MQLTFCGAARTVTGSCHLLTLDDGRKILLDCGLYQGNEPDYSTFNNDWLFDPAQIDVLVLSHAHIDHSGRIPKLVKDGYRGEIWCTHATKDLCAIMLMDSAFLQEKDAEWENRQHYRQGQSHIQPLYTTDDVVACMEQFTSIGYNRWKEILPGVELLYLDAGHILGSASVTLRIEKPEGGHYTVGFTGDIGRPNRLILRDPMPILPCDFLICESTYGGQHHEEAPREHQHFLEILQQTCVEQKGKLIIPAFSVGRTQEIVYMMDRMANEGLLPRIPVFVDSPLAISATEIFQAHPECFDDELRVYMQTDPDPFGFNQLQYIRKVEQSKELNERKEPCVIISASGMMEGGRIRHHVFNHCDDARNTILLVGFAPPHTLAGRIKQGLETLRMFGREKPFRARVECMDSFSAHGDEQEMLDFLEQQTPNKLKRLFLVHGEYDRQVAFRNTLLDQGFHHVEIPDLGHQARL
jgi:metallo-beta-lactamase family protein